MRHSGPSICGRSAAALLGACVCMGTAESTFAALIPNAISGVSAKVFNVFDSLDPGNGSPSRVVDGAGLTVGNVNTPSTWTHDATWQNSWLGRGSFASIDADTADTNGAWFVADLGASHSDLDKMWVWNNSYNTKGGAKLVDIYYATSPTVAPVTGSSYSFTSGGWTSLLTSHTIPKSPGGGTAEADETIDLSSIPSAQYIGFNIHTNWGFSTVQDANPRVGFSELQFTTEVPEPSAIFGLAAATALFLTNRRRKQAR